MDRNENEKRVWVFDPANNRDHDAGNHRGKPIQAPGWAANSAPGWADHGADGDEPRIILMSPSSGKTTNHAIPALPPLPGPRADAPDQTDTPAGPMVPGPRRPRRVRAWMVVVAVVCVLAAILAGLAVWQTVRVRDAVESCDSARSDVLELDDGLASAVDGGDAKEALSVTADQVEDPGTVTDLAAAAEDARLKVEVPACEVSWFDLHPGRALDDIEKVLDTVRARSSALETAVSAVLASRDAKTLADAADALKAKADQADALLKDSDGKVQDNATRDALQQSVDRARTLLDAGDDAGAMTDQATALDRAMTAVNESVKAKQDADAKAAAEVAAAAQAAQQAQQSYTPSYSGGGHSGGYSGGGYTPPYSGGSASTGGGSTGGGSSFGGGIPSGAVGGTGVPGGDSCVPVCIDGACQPCS